MIIEPDALLVRGPGRWNAKDVGAAWEKSMRAFKAALLDPSITRAGVLVGVPGAGKSTWCAANDRDDTVLLDAVWADPRRRMHRAARIRAAGKIPIAVFVRTPLTLCLQRNAARPPWRVVPDAVLRRSALLLHRWPPSRREGWAEIVVVDGAAASGILPACRTDSECG